MQSLLRYEGSTAAVVDTSGNFDVLRLYTLILAQLQRDAEIVGSARIVMGCGVETSVEDVAAKVLDHVKIMRVFDFVGVREAIGEIRDDLEGRKASKRRREDAKVEHAAKAKSPTPEPQPVPKRTVVADSEDEDEDEEMLFDASEPSFEPAPAAQQPVEPPEQAFHSQHEAEQSNIQEPDNPGKVKFILIDNLAQVLNPLLKKDYLQGRSFKAPFLPHTNTHPANALASTFLHSLNHLTRTHTLHTILANPATAPRAPSPARQPAPPEHQKQQPPPPPSIFASNTVVPSLASILPRYVDTSLLVSQMPRKKMDAKVLYRDGNTSRSVKKPRGVEMVNVLEVVSDRWDGRVGAWGTYVEGDMGIRDVS